MKRLAGALLFSSLVLAGCKTDGFCLDCQQSSSQNTSDGSVGTDDGGGTNGTDGGDCIPVPESCNGKDDDCNGLVDDGPLTDTGGECGTDVGMCHKGTLGCVAGKVVCGGAIVPPQAEVCNGIDDDCNGLVDDGNPGGGVLCGNGAGACTQGMTACVNGAVACLGGTGPTVEICDGIDNNCDGHIDEGDPGGGADCGAGPGVCVLGKIHCTGGQLTCVGAGGPIAELCNGVDDNCNGQVDEGFNTATDINNCGMCNHVCSLPFATAKCAAGACQVQKCAPDHWDIDLDPSNGCEYACVLRGVELCNGLDDDCNGTPDDGLSAAPDICAKQGECAGTVASCDGVKGWVCHYGATVSTNALGQIVPESDCDNKDNDCNAKIDDLFPNRGKACAKGLGACTTHGTQVCNGTHDALVCNAATPPAGTAEVCNGIADDCDGVLDNGAPDDWVTITVGAGTKQIYRYEASRPDATDVKAGSLTHRSCSTATRLPWVNVTYPEAVAACAAAGARLCAENEWQAACETSAAPVCDWSFSPATGCTAYKPLVCNDGNYDTDLVLPGIQNGVLPTGSLNACYSDWGAAGQVFDLSGNVKEWAQARLAGINPLRGGAYNNPPGGTICDANFVVADDTFLFADVGFRCCKD